MKLFILNLLFLWTLNLCSQQYTLTGTVYDASSKLPMPFASVYFNGTTNGTITDEKGEFKIPIDPAILELVVSYIGYETIVHQVDTSQINLPHAFYITPSSHLIETIQIKGERDDTWYRHLQLFKEYFLGSTEMSYKTKIINEEDIYFSFDEESGILTAFSRAPLEIINEGLGYKIYYDLVAFEFETKIGRTLFLGYPRFEELSRKPRKKWKKNREKAYRGSFFHFSKALVKNITQEEGFEVRSLIPAHDVPEEEVNARREKGISIIVEKRGKEIYSEKFNPYDSLQFIKGNAHLALRHKWHITFKGEKPDKIIAEKMLLPKRPYRQESIMLLTNDLAVFNLDGLLVDPRDIIVGGYWSHEKLADLLPLDYHPD